MSSKNLLMSILLSLLAGSLLAGTAQAQTLRQMETLPRSGRVCIHPGAGPRQRIQLE